MWYLQIAITPAWTTSQLLLGMMSFSYNFPLGSPFAFPLGCPLEILFVAGFLDVLGFLYVWK